ncbi:hypothetical protein E2C01_033456 [Portunus trituberculatus]|uniref:Uncharacterized protein n=1 Tax=Portunus trituberculatus TaxID=210409 RepID=A0A5B7F5K5_PORTR|nr:hypothetical protein [Portunus trituberculatus]
MKNIQMQCPLIILAVSCVATGQAPLPLLTRLLQPTLFTTASTPPHVDFHGTLKLTPPPPPVPPEFEPSPKFILPTTRSTESRSLKPASLTGFNVTTFTEAPTSSLLHSPTTIKFTLDDVSAYFHPQLIPPLGNIKLPEGSLSHDSPAHLPESPSKEVREESSEGDSVFLATVIDEDPAQYQWIVGSGEQDPSMPDTQQINDSKTGEGDGFEDPVVVSTESADTVFLPSFSFPLFTEPTEELATQNPVEAERLVAAASNLQSEPLQLAESTFNFFAVKPVKSKIEDDSESKTSFQGIKTNRPLSKTPVPQIVDLGEETENSAERLSESQSARRVLQFDQEFLTLLKRYHEQDKETNKTIPSSPDAKPFWLDGDAVNKADLAERLKSVLPTPLFSTSQPSQAPSTKTDVIEKLQSELSTTFFSSFKTSQAPKTKTDLTERLKSELTTTLFSTFKPSQAPKTDKSSGGVFTTSLRGLISTSASDVELEATDKTSEGPKVVPVGEVGELLHEEQEAGQDSEAPLSAAFKHGVQSINVSAWVSGCPKLYGKVKLNCAVHHDSPIKAAMVSAACRCHGERKRERERGGGTLFYLP